MSGNEFGERTHNFFGLEGLSQDQHHSQAIDGSWSNFSDGLAGNQRQTDPSLDANLKSYSTQHSGDPERGQSSNSHLGFNFTQQSIRPEYSRSLLQEHQNPTNGYMHGNLGLHAMPNEENVLGVDAETSRDKLSARGFTPDLHKSPMRFEMGESPVNYDFFGGQQQLNSQLPGMLQPFPRQQMSFNDMQLLKQQVMVKQMQEYQMQQLQKQQLEAKQLNLLNSNAVNRSRSSDNQSHSLINGVPLQDTSNNCWQPDLMTGNTNWMHRGSTSVVQGSSSGLMIPPEHAHGNLLAQQFEPSLYGMPVGGTNAPQNAFSSIQMNKLASQHGSANMSPSLNSQPISFLNQNNLHDSNMLPRSTYQEKMFSHTPVTGSNNRPNFESFRQDDSRKRNISVQEKFGQMEDSGLPEKSYMKVPGNVTALQKSTTLDPTEEKILFGSDDNLWEAFGNSIDTSLTGNLVSSNSDLYDACPSLQSGSWSALMQSAVAETSSDNAGVHEWGSKQQSVWANSNASPHANSHIGHMATTANTLNEGVHSDSTQTAVQHLHNRGNKVSDHGLLEKPMDQRFHSSNSGIGGNSSSIPKSEGIEDRLGIWKAASNPNIAALKEQNNHFKHNLQMQRASYAAENVSNVSRDVHGNIQQHLDNNSVEKAIPQLKSRDGSQILESFVNNNAGSNEMVNVRDFSMFPGGKETQFGQVGVRPSTPRKFQYHPMGNIDVADDPSREKVSHFGHPKSLGQPDMNIQIDRGHVSQNDVNCTNDAFKGIHSENSPSTSASADRSNYMSNQVKNASPRLELLHKVDQSQEQPFETTAPQEYGGQFQHSQSSASQGFNLQLAPPSQLASSPDNMPFSRNSLLPFNSLHSAPEKGGTSQSRFAPWASNQSFPQQSTHQGLFRGIPGESNMTSDFPYSRQYHQNQLMPAAAARQSTANHLVSSSSELATPLVKERDECNQAGISAPQHRFWNQPSKPQPDILRPHPLASNNIEGNFSRQEKTDELSSQNGGDMSLSGRDMVNMHELQSKDMEAKQSSDGSLMFSKMMQSNLQTFDRSLPSNNLSKDGHMAGIEDVAVDPQKVVTKGEQQSPSRSDGVRDGLNHKESSNQMVHIGQTVFQGVSHKNHSALAGADHQKVSPQMAPSWYNQYGTFKNGGLAQPVNDTRRFTHLKIGEQSSNVGSLVDGTTQSFQSSKQFNMQKMSGSAPGLQAPSSESLPHGAADKLLKFDKSKKRKTATSELLSWNKEVMLAPKRLKTLSETEVDWARATNRFAEKVQFETLLEDGTPFRSKRRLIYTTQLMQQLFHPSPGRVMISSVVSSNYEFVLYTAARASLGDACSSTSTELFSPPNDSNPLSARTKTEKISDQYISKAAEDFISRTQTLETDFARLENGTTIADLRVEVQDLEKFGMINRFARFHPSSSSSSMDRNISSVRLNSQRYVTIAPMPKNIPDSVQCLSL